ncbi:aspartate aminotransferase family protein [Tenacibaculum ovolyticum]|uniref:aspartate aminotransferase family protein n=1 Tax=Tenacibaculum ovolyticum TaxID=104270 RepID=UPI0004209674|nr:aspartate aminotransferase family protein [Tenacibaculum ovolyticum]
MIEATHKFSRFHLSESANIVSDSIPGERSKELLELQKEIEGSVVSYPKSMPFAIERAKGAIIEDVDGNQFIDFFAGCGVVNVGHCNEEVLSYVKEQQEKLIHALDFPTENKLEAIQKILKNLPKAVQNDYKVSFGGPTGSDAVEAAIKLAKIKTGRDGIIAFSGSYHGMTSGALAVTADTDFRKELTSLIPNVHFTPFSYQYRCPSNDDDQACKNYAIERLKFLLENKHSGITKPAAIIVESIQGEGGNIPPVAGFLNEVVEVAHRNDVLVIFDEIQSGFFRTGEFLACMNYGVMPDIITLSKGLGGIGFPISALVYKKEVEAWGPGAHIGTFRANQVSLAAANGAFNFIEKYDVKSHTKEMGAYLMDGLMTIAKKTPFIGDIRGKGLMIGVEFVKDVFTKEPYPEFVKELRNNCLQKGLLFEVGGHYNNVLRLVPPLTITPKIIDEALLIMQEVLDITIPKDLQERNKQLLQTI